MMSINRVDSSNNHIPFSPDDHRGQIIFGIQSTISNINALVRDGVISKHEGRILISELTNISSNPRNNHSLMIKELNNILGQMNSSLPDRLKYPEFQLNNAESPIENFNRYLNLLRPSSQKLEHLQHQAQEILHELRNGSIPQLKAIDRLRSIISQANEITEGQAAYPLPPTTK